MPNKNSALTKAAFTLIVLLIGAIITWNFQTHAQIVRNVEAKSDKVECVRRENNLKNDLLLMKRDLKDYIDLAAEHAKDLSKAQAEGLNAKLDILLAK